MIYAGTWENPGTPFLAEAKVLHSTPAGGVAARSATRITAHPKRHDFRRTISHIAQYWNNELTQDERDLWSWILGPGSRKDLTLKGYYCTFATFAARHFAQVWRYGNIIGPHLPYGNIEAYSAIIDHVSTGLQQITFTFTWTRPFPEEPTIGSLITYQIPPHARHRAWPCYATRMVDNNTFWDDEPPLHYTRTVNSAWTFREGDRISLFWRLLDGVFYDWHYMAGVNAPPPI